MITVTVLAGPLFSAPAALFVIEAIVEYPSIDNVIPGLLIFVVILPVVIWSCVLFAMLIQGKIRHTRTFLWQFAVLYCYGVAISLLMNFAVALASV